MLGGIISPVGIQTWQVSLCRGGQEYKRTVPISGSINPFGQIRISPLIVVSHIGLHPLPTATPLALLAMTFAPLGLMDNYQRPGRSSITISETQRPANRRFCISTGCSLPKIVSVVRFVYCFSRHNKKWTRPFFVGARS